MKKNTKKNFPAFTMLELIVVIAMLAIVMAVSAPRIFKTLYRGKLRGEANTLMSAITYSQGMAAIQRATYRVHFNIDNNEYYVTRDAGRGDDFELTEDDLTTSGGSSLFPGESARFSPEESDNDEEDIYFDDEACSSSNRNAAGRVSIFDEETHKLPAEIKILKIIDNRGDEYNDGTFELPLDPQGRSIDTTVVIGKSEDDLKYEIHIGANGIIETTVDDENQTN